MFLVLSKNDSRILAIAEEVTYQTNGYPVANNVAYYNAIVTEVQEIPEGVEPYTWAYVDGEFVQIVTPEPVEDELTDAISALELLGYSSEMMEVENG